MDEKLNMILEKLTQLNAKLEVIIGKASCACKKAQQIGKAPAIGSSGEIETE